MYTTSDLHHLIGKGAFGMAKDIFDNSTSFHTGNDMFKQNTDTRYERVLCFCFWWQLFPCGFFLRLIYVDTRWVVSLQPCILEQTNIGGQHELFCITHMLVMDTSGRGLTARAHEMIFHITNAIVFHRMPFFLPLSAIVQPSLSIHF